MTIRLELLCSGPLPPGNGCPECETACRFEAVSADSHSGLQQAYAGLLKIAEEAGWQRLPKDQSLRCPCCAATTASAYPVDIGGIAWERFIEAAELCVAGHSPVTWSGRDGLPSATQFRNALSRFPALREIYAQAPTFGGGRGKPRAGKVEEDRWSLVLERFRAGETKAGICTGEDGWPTVRQWHLRRKVAPAFAQSIDQATASRKDDPARTAPGRKARAGVHDMERARQKEERRQARAAASALLKEQRRAEAEARRRERDRQNAESRAERERLRQQAAERRKRAEAEGVAIRNELRRREREARRLEKERERVRRIEERRVAPRATRVKKVATYVRTHNLLVSRQKVVRLKVDPPEVRFDRRLGAPDAEGCRHFIGPVPATVDIGGGKSMKPERAALFFAAVAVPKGQLVEHTCWNDTCFAAAHLTPVPADWRKKSPASIPEEVVETAGDVVAGQFGVARADLNATVDRARAPRQIAFARQVFRYLLSVEMEFATAMVARAADCDRTTVMHGNHVVEDRRDDTAFDKLMDRIAADLRHRIQQKGENCKATGGRRVSAGSGSSRQTNPARR